MTSQSSISLRRSGVAARAFLRRAIHWSEQATKHSGTRATAQGEPLPRKQSAQSLLPPVRLIVSGATSSNGRRSGHDSWVPPSACDGLLALRYLLMDTMAVPSGTSHSMFLYTLSRSSGLKNWPKLAPIPGILSSPRRLRSFSVAGGGERADLVIGATAAGAKGRRGVEASGADADGGGLHGGDRLLEVGDGRRVAAHNVRVDEAQLEPLGQGAGHLLPGQRVHLQLEAIRHAAVGVLLPRELAGLVVDDDRAEDVLVHSVVSPAHAVRVDREDEFLFHPARFGALGFLVIPEPPERLAPGRLARLFVLAGQEALGRLVAARAIVDDVLTRPCAIVHGQQIVERRVVADDPAPQVVLDHLVHDGAVGHRMVAANRNAPNVDVEVLERTGLIVVDLLVAEVQLGLGRQRLQDGIVDLRGRRVVLDLLDGANLERPARVARQVERLQHEQARLALTAAAVVAGVRQEQLTPRARHADVEEPPLFLQVMVAGRHHVLREGDRQLERVAPAAQRKLLLDQVDEEHHGELEALGLVDGEDADRGRLDIRLGNRRVLAGLDQLVQVLHELAHVVVAERT